MQATNWSRNLGIEVRGDDVVSHTGSVIVRMLADKTGLTNALSAALTRPDVIHDRGAVFRDMAVTIADGGTLHIRLDPLPAPRHTTAIAELCRVLNDTNTIYPGTTLTLRYSAKSHR